MDANSRPVHSSQPGCHTQLASVVRRHLQKPSRRPAAPHTLAAFETVRAWVEHAGRPLILDAYCGTGMSTAALARTFPDHSVIGIDKSRHRLDKHAPAELVNYRLVQADCGDFWRLAAAAGWRAEQQWLLYPNPWPKPGQLQRRVHGSADFPALLALGGQLELRSNWPVYVEEFAEALRIAGQQATVEPLTPAPAMTLHERKYADSGHPLWRCRCRVRDNTTTHLSTR
ncbi:MAG: methyltransferase domain-containing protein [Halieaceae bacterium]|jgi:tRNA G46 methylase TrmB|nr:methyltransferase domain-containing protein [Halieaceae bacterium]